jgi:hypothetical protein
MGYFDKAPGDTLTAANVDTLMLQSVMRFADSAARDTALSAVLAEGLVTYQDDANTYTWYNGSAWVILTEPSQTWTPEIKQPGVIAHTKNWGFYQRQNGVYIANCKLTITGSGTAGNAITVSAPLTQVVGFGGFTFYDTSLAIYRSGNVLPQSTTLYSFIIDSGAAEYGIAGGDGMTNGDVVWLQVTGTY